MSRETFVIQIRRTCLPALFTPMALSFGGWCLEQVTPEAHPFGPAIDGFLAAPSTNQSSP
jgi:hypothetical protein